MSAFEPGEHVRITIDARIGQPVAGQSENDLMIQYRTELGIYEDTIAVDSEAVKVERVAPAEWPPRPGDLWRGTRLWFTRSDGYGNPIFLSGDNDPQRECEWVNQKEGPLALVHREEADR